jgi:hypothetical protein
MLIRDFTENAFVCKDKLVRYLAIDYVVTITVTNGGRYDATVDWD